MQYLPPLVLNQKVRNELETSLDRDLTHYFPFFPVTPTRNQKDISRFRDIMENNGKLTVVGLMSGTSLDGCDVVLLDIEQNGDSLLLKTKDFITHPMPDVLRNMIVSQLQPEKSRITSLSKLDAALSHWFIDAVDALLKHSELTRNDVDLIGSHGQTMWHDVNGDLPMTWQLGDGSFIAAVTGITTVCDFRTADVGVGGQGAPLIPFFDQLIYGGGELNVALQNIGGISNVTLVPSSTLLQQRQTSSSPSNSLLNVMGFDTGPGNMIIDRFMERISEGRVLFDQDGAFAAKGAVCEELLSQWMLHPFFHMAPPKSTGREQFGHAYADDRYLEAVACGLSDEDAVATATALTARTIGLAYRVAFGGDSAALFPHKVVVAGGGAHNLTLMRMIAEEVAPAEVTQAGAPDSTAISRGNEISSDSKEAVAFAVFAYQAVFGRPNHLPCTTGASRQVTLGKICPGSNYQHLLLRPRNSADKAANPAVCASPNVCAAAVTESRHPASSEIDLLSAEQVVALMNAEDAQVVNVVAALRPEVAKVAERVAECIRMGGHVFYVGAGSSGRIGVLDASEIPPTYSAPADWFQGVIAGGDTALRTAVEGAEDSREGGARDLEGRVSSLDVVIGIAASGRTPYVHGALQYAKELRAHTVLFSCNPVVEPDSYVDTVLTAVVGPELVTGSTRMKAGTATKLVLNQISTTAMVLLGKVHGNLMVDLKASNQKLRRRALGIVQTVCGSEGVTVGEEEAEELLLQAGGRVKLAVLMRVAGVSREQAEGTLAAVGDRLRDALLMHHQQR